MAHPKHLQARTDVNVIEDEASSLTGNYATVSQHFLPPPVADVDLVPFTHSNPSCLLVSTVAETLSHFKGCESGFLKKNAASLQPLQRPECLCLSPSFTGSCSRHVSVVKLLQVNRVFP